jgi:hypothetical protein
LKKNFLDIKANINKKKKAKIGPYISEDFIISRKEGGPSLFVIWLDNPEPKKQAINTCGINPRKLPKK